MHLPAKLIKNIGGLSFKSFFYVFGPLKKISIILMYHRVVKEPFRDCLDPAMFVSSKAFEMHIKEISQFFDIVPLEAIAEANLKKRLCAITFDDGWADNYDFAFPILKKYNIPATIFIPVNMIGSKKKFWFQSIWDICSQAGKNGLQVDCIRYFNTVIPAWKPEYIDVEQIDKLISELKHLPAQELNDLAEQAYRSLGLTPESDGYILNWEQVREMSKNGITFGSHGLNHYILPSLSREMKKKEIFDSFGILKEKGISVSSFFSFPNGDWDNESLALVKEAGYKGALTTRVGYNTAQTDPFLLNRIAVHDDATNTPSLLWFRILQAVSRAS